MNLRGIRQTAIDATTLTFERELAEFVHEHHARLIRLAVLVCHDVTDAEDAVQAAFEQAWRHRASLRDSARMKPWLDRIVVRESIRIGHRRSGLLGGFFRRAREIAVEPEDPTEPLANRVVRRTAVRIAYEALPDAQRAVVALHLYAGYSMPETAGLLGVPLETARSRLRLARERLRDQLGEDAG